MKGSIANYILGVRGNFNFFPETCNPITYCLKEDSQIITPCQFFFFFFLRKITPCQLNNINKLLKIKINYSKITPPPPPRCMAPHNSMGLFAMQYREDG